MTSENCPKCNKKLPPPFKSSGRQVCSNCGWSNKLKPTKKSKASAKPKSKLSLPLPKFSKKTLTVGGCSMAALIVLLWGFASWSDTRVACKTKDGEPAYKVLKNIHAEWEDAVELAGSTSRMSLPPLIGKLQEVKRKVETQEWKECAEPAVSSLSDSMKHTISALITFLDSDNSEWMYKSDLEKAREKQFEYAEEYVKLMPSKEKRIQEEKAIAEEKKALAELEESRKKARETMAIVTLGSAIRGQQTYHFENNEFTKSTSEVYLDDYDNEHYEIKIVEADDDIAIVVANAKQKEGSLRSYAEAIAYDGGSYERISCETEKTSTVINIPIFRSGEWICGSGSNSHE